MKLVLTNHYPFPYPKDISEAEGEKISTSSQNKEIELLGVKHFEMKHTVTVEFVDQATYEIAQLKTGWKAWGSDDEFILEAQTSGEDGYGHFPAIIAANEAWCGHMLMPEVHTTTTVTHR